MSAPGFEEWWAGDSPGLRAATFQGTEAIARAAWEAALAAGRGSCHRHAVTECGDCEDWCAACSHESEMRREAFAAGEESMRERAAVAAERAWDVYEKDGERWIRDPNGDKRLLDLAPQMEQQVMMEVAINGRSLLSDGQKLAKLIRALSTGGKPE